MVNLPYFVFVMKAGRIEKTSLREVSVIIEQCRTKWTAFAKNVTTEIKSKYCTAVSPRLLFLPARKQSSAPEGPVTYILDAKEPARKMTPERKSQLNRIIEEYKRLIYS
jgi:hypothetical protein